MKHLLASCLFLATLSLVASPAFSYYKMLVTCVAGDSLTWYYYPEENLCADMECIGVNISWILPGDSSIYTEGPLLNNFLPRSAEYPLKRYTAYAVVDSSDFLWRFDLEETERWHVEPGMEHTEWLWSNWVHDRLRDPPIDYIYAMTVDSTRDSCTIHWYIPQDLSSENELHLRLRTRTPERKINVFYPDAYPYSDGALSPLMALWWCDQEFDSIFTVTRDMDSDELLISGQLIHASANNNEWPDVVDFVYGGPAYGGSWALHRETETTWELYQRFSDGTFSAVPTTIHSDVQPQLELPQKLSLEYFGPAWTTHSDTSGWAIQMLQLRGDTVLTFPCANEIREFAVESYGHGAVGLIWTEYDSDADSLALYKLGYSLVGVPELGRPLPVLWSLSPAYPNPFNSTTTIQIALGARSPVTVELFNLLGQRVKLISDGLRPAGISTITIDASNLASGVYFIRASAYDGAAQTRRITLLR